MRKNITISFMILEIFIMLFGVYLFLGRFAPSAYSLGQAIGELLSNIGIVLVVLTSIAFVFTLRSLKKTLK